MDATAFILIKDDAEKNKLSSPSKYKYIFQSLKMDYTGLPEDYPYNWYLGGKIYKYRSNNFQLYFFIVYGRSFLEMSTLAFVENMFRCALFLPISENFFNISFPGIVCFCIVLQLLLFSFTLWCFTKVLFPCVGILGSILHFALVLLYKKNYAPFFFV